MSRVRMPSLTIRTIRRPQSLALIYIGNITCCGEKNNARVESCNTRLKRSEHRAIYRTVDDRSIDGSMLSCLALTKLVSFGGLLIICGLNKQGLQLVWEEWDFSGLSTYQDLRDKKNFTQPQAALYLLKRHFCLKIS